MKSAGRCDSVLNALNQGRLSALRPCREIALTPIFHPPKKNTYIMKHYFNTLYFPTASAFRMKAFCLRKPGQFNCSTSAKFILSFVFLLGMGISTVKAAEDHSPPYKPIALSCVSEAGAPPYS